MKQRMRLPFAAVIAAALLFVSALAAGLGGAASPAEVFSVPAFYFTSPLGENSVLTPEYREDGSLLLSIPVRNYESGAAVTEKDIPYSVSVSARGCAAQVQSGASGTLPGGAAAEDTVRVRVTGYRAGKSTVTVTAESTAPYEKVLSFTLSGQNTAAALLLDTAYYAAPYGENAALLRLEYGAAVPEITVYLSGGVTALELPGGARYTDDGVVIPASPDNAGKAVRIVLFKPTPWQKADAALVSVRAGAGEPRTLAAETLTQLPG